MAENTDIPNIRVLATLEIGSDDQEDGLGNIEVFIIDELSDFVNFCYPDDSTKPEVMEQLINNAHKMGFFIQLLEGTDPTNNVATLCYWVDALRLDMRYLAQLTTYALLSWKHKRTPTDSTEELLFLAATISGVSVDIINLLLVDCHNEAIGEDDEV